VTPDDLGPFPRVHPRSDITAAAKNELAAFLLDWRERHRLTEAEYLSLVLGETAKRADQLVGIERRKA
jgi:hypothetical protein